MSVLIAIILGIIQGLTEFLPVSSSGHLVLFQRIFGLAENQLLFDVLLHLATLIAVCIVFYKPIIQLIKNPLGARARMLGLATGITLLIAFLFEDFFESAFHGGLLAFSFFVTAAFLVFAEYMAKTHKNQKRLNYKNTSVMGLFQGLAILPGISRAGATISSAVVQGVEKREAAEFSFLMSIPIILVSLVWQLLKTDSGVEALPVFPTVLGFLFALLSGVFAIKIMLKVIATAKYSYFSFYLVLLGIILLFNQYVFGWF